MLMAAYLTTAFVVVAVGSFHLVRKKKDATNAQTMTSMGLWMIAIVAPLQLIAGDMHGLNTLEHQPAKVAAMEGHYETKSGAPLILFGVPDDEKEQVSYELSIPKLGSLILKHDPDGEVKGLKEWPKDERPPAEIIFYSFRLMVGIGMLMILVGIVSLWLRFKNKLFHALWFHRALIFFGPLGFIAVIAGWVTTEVGRQPYTVYGLLTTAQSVSPIDTLAVSLSLLTFIVTYFVIFGAGVIYLFRQFSVDPDSIELSNEEVKQAGSVKNIIHFVERVRS
jgi:cytochrome d ubiquinol oxidase subunit I